MVGESLEFLADGLHGDPGRLVEREPADAGPERRERDAPGADLAGAGHRRPDGLAMTGPLVRRSRSRDTAWMTARAASDPAGVTIGPAQRDRRLADSRELDRVAAGALDGAPDAGRHPQREVGGVHDGVDLEVADVAVPELDPSQLALVIR